MQTRRLNIRPSRTCNMACSYCDIKPSVDGVSAAAPIDKITELIARVSPDEIVLCGWGETVLCPNFIDVYRAVQKTAPRAKKIIISNITARPVDWWRGLLAFTKTPVCVVGSVHLEADNLLEMKAVFDAVKSPMVWPSFVLIMSRAGIENYKKRFANIAYIQGYDVSYMWDQFLARAEIDALKTELDDMYIERIPEQKYAVNTKTGVCCEDIGSLTVGLNADGVFDVRLTNDNLTETVIGALDEYLAREDMSQ